MILSRCFINLIMVNNNSDIWICSFSGQLLSYQFHKIRSAGTSTLPKPLNLIPIISGMVYKYCGHSKWPVFHVTFSPVTPFFCTASHDTTAKLWRTDHASPLRIFAGHSAPVSRCEFHPNGSYVVTASEDPSCRLWDVSSGNGARVVPFKSYVSALAISPNGKVLACALISGDVLLWDIATTKVLRKYATENSAQTNGYHSDTTHKVQKKVISHCTFVHENTLVTGDSHGNIMAWDTRLHSKLHNKPIQHVNVAGRVKGLSCNKSGLLVVGIL